MTRFGRFLIAVTMLAALFSPACFSGRAWAQQAALPAACQGSPYIVRVSEIKPGMMPKFIAAVAAQQAWYKAAGATDEIRLLRVADGGSLSESKALTMHIAPPGGTRPAPDAAYGAFVAMFRESSTIKEEFITCVAKP